MFSIGQHAKHCLFDLYDYIIPGNTVFEIEEYVGRYCAKHRIRSAQFGYRIGNLIFPRMCCISINDEICHGIPSLSTILKEDDIVKVDVSFKDEKNWHGDACWTYCLNQYDPPPVLSTAFLACSEGIRAVKIGNTLGDIGAAIETYVNSKGFEVIEDFTGHAIGKKLHGDYAVPLNFNPEHPHSSMIIKPGMMFTIEPMIASTRKSFITENRWTAKTIDGSMSAQFEHTIGIDKDENVVIFTL